MKKNLILLVLMAAAPTLAQEEAGPRQDSLKGVVLKKLAPVSTEVLRIKLPPPADRKLKNGLPVMVLENHRLPTVALDLVIPVSSLNDPADLPGVAEATAALMREGTKTRNSRQVAEELAGMAASLFINTGYGSRSTHLVASALVENLDGLLALAGDVLLNPTFPQDELDKWKKRKLSSLQMMRTQPGFLADELLRKVLYPGDVRSVNSATAASVQKLTRQNLVDFYKAWYRPGLSLLGVTGDVKPDEITAKLEKRIGAWEAGRAAEPAFALRAPIDAKKIYLVNRPNSVQTALILANRAIDRKHPDYIACMVMNRILGAGPASRLFRNLREEKGFTYGIYSGFTALQYLQHFSASTSVRTEVTGPAIEEILSEFRSIREKPAPQEELENARRAIVAGFALSLERQASVLSQRLLLREYGFPDDYWDTYPDKVMAVTAEDVQRVARKYVPLDNVQLIAVGDATKIAGVLAKFGAVEQYDSEGRKAE